MVGRSLTPTPKRGRVAEPFKLYARKKRVQITLFLYLGPEDTIILLKCFPFASIWSKCTLAEIKNEALR